MVCLRKPYQFNFFKGCLPQILLGAFLNTFSHMWMTFNLKAIKNLYKFKKEAPWIMEEESFELNNWHNNIPNLKEKDYGEDT